MKKVYQTIRSGPQANCLQACLASIFEVEISDVVNFAKDITPENDETPEGGLLFWNRFDAWLESYGLRPIFMRFRNLEYVDEPGTFWTPPGWHLIFGKRGETNHVVVGHRGTPVHDPLKDAGPLTFSSEGYVLFVSALDGGSDVNFDG